MNWTLGAGSAEVGLREWSPELPAGLERVREEGRTCRRPGPREVGAALGLGARGLDPGRCFVAFGNPVSGLSFWSAVPRT